MVIPEKYAQTLDVTDFATPVQSISTTASANGGRMVMQITGNVNTSAYQTSDQYVVDITPKKATKSEKPLPGEPPVYTGIGLDLAEVLDRRDRGGGEDARQCEGLSLEQTAGPAEQSLDRDRECVGTRSAEEAGCSELAE